MNAIEQKIVTLLNDLKKHYLVTDVKAEMEAEASRMNELMRLKDIADSSGVGFILKIGGCEAVTDMYAARDLGVTGIIAPMIETPYAMSKYLAAIGRYFRDDVREHMHFGVNIETVTAYKNFSEMLALPDIHLIDSVTLGRVDMSGSLGIDRNDINSDDLYTIAAEIFTSAKKKGLSTTMGGGIAKEAIPFIRKLMKKKLLDRFETRKIVVSTGIPVSRMEDVIIKANIFELLWLENKKRHYAGITNEEDSRIEMLMSRIYKLNSST